jgi:AcrR family transcriptional regulator
MRSRTDAGAALKSEKREKGDKSDATRLRILTSALELFHERGFEAATMRDIATRATVATGAAYYYFTSKDAIVLAFYSRAADDMAPQLEEVLSGSTDLRKRLTGILEVKLRYFEPSRRLLTALAAHVDPMNPLSPFSGETREIREQDIAVFARAITGTRLRVPEDLEGPLPRILWMYQMGLILYWIHDTSPSQEKTRALIQKSLRIVVRLLQLSSLPLMRPLRRQVLELWDVVNDGGVVVNDSDTIGG